MSGDIAPPSPPSEQVRAFVRLVDDLEGRTPGYLTLDALRASLAPDLSATLDWAVQDDLLLVDHRHRLDERTGAIQPVTVCRLNRHHPTVRSRGSPTQL